jgi:23S rRNA (adenine2503-C2)-methyltransferase
VVIHPEPSDQCRSRPLLGLGRAELEAWAQQQGQSAFRGRQLHDWIYAKGARELEAIHVLPKAWRQQLAGTAPTGAGDWIGRLREVHRSVAADGTTTATRSRRWAFPPRAVSRCV